MLRHAFDYHFDWWQFIVWYIDVNGNYTKAYPFQGVFAPKPIEASISLEVVGRHIIFMWVIVVGHWYVHVYQQRCVDVYILGHIPWIEDSLSLWLIHFLFMPCWCIWALGDLCAHQLLYIHDYSIISYTLTIDFVIMINVASSYFFSCCLGFSFAS